MDQKPTVILKAIHNLISNNFHFPFLVLTLMLSLIPGHSQEDKIAFEKFGVPEGLPEEAATNIVQDNQGFMWITTQNGLVKFDGYKMQVYRDIEGDSSDLRIRNLNGGILKDHNGKLWMGGVSAGGGLYEFDPITGKFYYYSPDPEDASNVQNHDCFLLFQDIAGDIWFTSIPPSGIENSLLCKINPETKEISRYPYATTPKTNDVILNSQMSESKKDSTIWIISKDNSKLMRYERKRDTFELVFQKGDLLPGTQLRDSLEVISPAGKSGLIPMGNSRNLYLWDPRQKKVVESYGFPFRKDMDRPGYAFEDHYGNIWAIHPEGITLINRKDSSQVNYIPGEGTLDLEGIPEIIDAIRPAYQDENFILFNIWSRPPFFISHLRYTFSSGKFDFYDFQFNDSKNEFTPSYRRFYKDQTDLIWIASRPNFYKKAPKTRQLDLFRHDPEKPGTIPSDTIFQIFEDSHERLWIGTQNGISLKKEDDSFQQFYSNEGGNSKSLGEIHLIYEDQTGGLWAGTYGKGLFKFNEERQKFQHVDFLKGVDTSEFSYDIEALLEDESGHLWVSVWRRGVYVLNKESGRLIEKYEPTGSDIHGMASDYIPIIYQDVGGTIWLADSGDNEHGLFAYQKNENTFKPYTFDAQDSTSLISNEVRFIGEDDLNRLWIGTDDGICLYDREQDQFLRNTDLYGIPSTTSFQRAEDGRIWVTTYSGGGLVLVGPDVDDVEYFGEEQGLLHNDVTITSLLSIDKKGGLWLPNQRGLSVLDTHTKTYKHYLESEGFQTYSRYYTSYSTKSGEIWIGGFNGLNRIDPEQLSQIDASPPEVVITNMGILGKMYSAADGVLFENAVSYSEAVELDHTQRDLSFEFVALHYLSPKDNLYSWKLENYDQDWTDPSGDRKASYTNLSPGEYVFRVKGSNADGIWNEEGTQIRITIRPPWWLTGWAYSLYAVLIGILAYLVFRAQKERTIRKEREKAREKELKQAKEIEKAYAELKTTQAQLIQSEKMASLGELTAGIAHEIQNPLNFVNNFSDVSRELIEELKEESTKKVKERDTKIEQDLLTDIDQNLEKISHHGKRADSIVKGMLQHSRSSDGKKEPTDLNALADEYLRLAYHGLRAKDKSFNASMETDFDPGVGKIEVIPQEIGRVLLNLFTNAFHAVGERKEKDGAGYEPTVWVKTQKTGDGVEISVRDNGGGIPDDIREKIFQPFFTTKPTGEGTGLGLSMSYDIVTKGHNGKLKVQSNPGDGAVFFVILPV